MVERWPLMMWKDPNELLQAQNKNKTEGFTLRDWVSLGVDIAHHYLTQEVNPLAREVQEAFDLDPFSGSGDFLGDVEEEEEPLPKREMQISPGALASAFDQAISVLGGSGVVLNKHDGRSLEATYPTVTKIYSPVTLPVLPRKACPHTNVTLKRVSDEMSNGKPGRGCIGKPLQNGWCVDHQGSQELLDIGARLNYPEVLNLGKFRVRAIGEGVGCWEASAEAYNILQIKQDILQIKARYHL